ncbi:MAG: cell division protein FtsL [Gammaproteobacteria bacterium]|jgi:cell division protein FtsL|nr:cell division protein FtsL [Gammaproteobacteria bacterium]
MNASPLMRLVVPGLLLLTLLSSLAVVYTTHESRRQFTHLQQLNSQRDELVVDWWRLQIEESYWSTHARIDREARERLGMHIPQPSDVFIVSQ